LGRVVYSVQIYSASMDFSQFNPHDIIEKWATVEVTDHDNIPGDMEPLTLPEGTYAVFIYKGKASEAAATFQYFYGTWLPASGYVVDRRPHFEILGEKYKNEQHDSEEEIWIPVKLS